jgi:hypothetical protein
MQRIHFYSPAAGHSPAKTICLPSESISASEAVPPDLTQSASATMTVSHSPFPMSKMATSETLAESATFTEQVRNSMEFRVSEDNVTVASVLSQYFKISNASSHDIHFLLLVRNYGIGKARDFVRGFGWNCEDAIRALENFPVTNSSLRTLRSGSFPEWNSDQTRERPWDTLAKFFNLDQPTADDMLFLLFFRRYGFSDARRCAKDMKWDCKQALSACEHMAN